jgi:hypothetical protein
MRIAIIITIIIAALLSVEFSYKRNYFRNLRLSRNRGCASQLPHSGQASEPQNSSNEPLQFFKTCRLPIFSTTIENFAADKISFPDRILKLRSSDERIDMFALPTRLNGWPTFYASKQRRATDKHLFFQQISSTHSKRFNAIVDHLRNDEIVVSTGLAGIGKSSELNAYLMKFLANIGDSKWPPEVWYRFDDILLQFCLTNGEPEVTYVDDVSLNVLLKLTRDYMREPLEKRPVLFLELKEDEVNPCSHIATLLQPSNRDVYTLTKEFEKSNAIYMLIKSVGNLYCANQIFSL